MSREERHEIALDCAKAEAFFFRPDDIGEFPGVVFLTDIWGIRPANIGMAKRLSDQGFAVLMPNILHRYAKLRPDGFEPQDSGARQKLVGVLLQSLSPEQMQSDGRIFVEHLLRQDGVLGHGGGGTAEPKRQKIGVVGYCFSGAMAIRMAAATPEQIACAVSFHGGWLVSDTPLSPHKLLPQIKARLYFGHAENDPTMTLEQIHTLEKGLHAWHGAFESEIYQGAMHGWTVPGRDIYNELQAERAFAKLSEVLHASLE